MTVTLNNDQQLYVIPCGDGYSCRGFQSLFDEVTLLADMLEGERPTPDQLGTMALYERHGKLLNLANQRGLLNRTWFSLNTPTMVRHLLEVAREHRGHLRLFYGDTDTGRDWMGEHDLCGYIGRSTGMLKVPLLMETSRSGGGAILTDCIVRIIDTATKRELYRHPQYHMPALTRHETTDLKALAEAYYFEVRADGEVQARFKDSTSADNYIAFMEGRRMRP